jgi:hypothetical protein
LKSSVETNKLTQQIVQKLKETTAEMKTCSPENKTNESARLVAAQQEIQKLKMESLELKSARKEEALELKIQNLQREVNEKRASKFN